MSDKMLIIINWDNANGNRLKLNGQCVLQFQVVA